MRVRGARLLGTIMLVEMQDDGVEASAVASSVGWRRYGPERGYRCVRLLSRKRAKVTILRAENSFFFV